MDDNLLGNDLINNDITNEMMYYPINFIKHHKFALILVILMILFLMLMIILFVIVKILQISLDRILFFYDYNKLCKKKLKMYGNCKISKIYLARNSLCKLYIFLINLFTLFQYDEIVNKSEDNFPYHTMLVLEVKLSDNRI